MTDTKAPLWLATREEDGDVIFRIGRLGDKLVAEWPFLCTLVAEPDGSAFTLEPAEDSDPLLFEKVRRGAARAMVESLKGRLSLHAGAVAMHGCAVVLLGRNHAGKSTAIAELCMRGGALLADDIALLDERDGRVFVEPTEGHHWLDQGSRQTLGLPADDDEATMKVGVGAGLVSAAAAPLAAVVSLAFGEGPARLEPLTGLSVVADLVPSVVRFSVDDSGAHQRELAGLMSFATRVPFYRLTRPLDLRLVHEGGKLLEGLLRGGDR